MMMRVNANTVSAARVGTKTCAMPVLAPRRVVSVSAAKESKDQSTAASLQGGLAAVSAFCLGVSLLISPVQPALAVLPPDNGAGLIKSFENAIPQPLNSKKESAAAYKDPAVEAKKDTAQYSDVDYTKKASDAIKGGVQNIKEAVTGAADSAKDNASDAASDIKVNANKLGNKVAYLGTGDRAADKISEGSKDIADNAKSANAFLAGKASKAVKNVKEATGNAVEGVKSGASNVSEKAENGFSKVDMSRVNLNAKQVALLGAKDTTGSGKQNSIEANAYLKNKTNDIKNAVADKNQGVSNKTSSIPGNAYLNRGQLSNVRSNTSTDIQGNAFLQSKLGRDVKSKVDGDVQATKNTASSINNNGLSQVKEGAKDALSNVSDKAPSSNSVNAFLKGKASAAKDAITDKAQDLGDAAKDATRNVKYGAKDAAADIKSSVKSVAYVPTDTNDVQSGMNDLADDAKKVGGQKKESANAFLQGKGQQTKNAVSDKIENAGDAAKKVGDNIKAAAQNVKEGGLGASRA